MSYNKKHLGISHIDKTGNQYKLFEIIDNDGQFTLSFTNETQRFFPKAFSNEDFQNGSTTNIEKINSFLKFYLPKEMSHLINNERSPIENIELASRLRLKPILITEELSGKIFGKIIPLENILHETNKKDPDYNEKCQHNKKALERLELTSKELHVSNEISFPGIMKMKNGKYKRINIRTHKKQNHTDKLELHSQFILSQTIQQYNKTNKNVDQLMEPSVSCFTSSDNRVYSFEDYEDTGEFYMKEGNLNDGSSGVIYSKEQLKSDLSFDSKSIVYFYQGRDTFDSDYDGFKALTDTYKALNFNLLKLEETQLTKEEFLNKKEKIIENVDKVKTMSMFSLINGCLNEDLKIKIIPDSRNKINTFEPLAISKLKFNTKGTGKDRHLLNNISLSNLSQITVIDKIGRVHDNWAKEFFIDEKGAKNNKYWIMSRAVQTSFKGNENKKGTLDKMLEKDLISESVYGSVNDYFLKTNKKEMSPNDYYNYERTVNNYNQNLENKYSKKDVIIDTKKEHSVSRHKLT